MSETQLPENFPGREPLATANITTVEQVRGMSDEGLRAVKGVGDKTIADMRVALAALVAPTTEAKNAPEAKTQTAQNGTVTVVFE